MYNHAPDGYPCPFCLIANGIENEQVLTCQSDVVYHDQLLTAFISARQWPQNQGHVIVIPNAHYENIFDLPPDLGTPIQRLAQALAIAMKREYGCEGISTRQHNEPAGNQDVWHYHLHIFPRYAGDDLYQSAGQFMQNSQRAVYAARLRRQLANQE